MDTRKKLTAACGVAATVGALTFGLAATPASAATTAVSPHGCGTTAATLYYGSNIVYSKSCSGDYAISPAKLTTRLVAYGWSGAVYDTNNNAYYFCDWQTITVNAYVRELFLNATKPPRCG
jgi:hypothetical protein